MMIATPRGLISLFIVLSALVVMTLAADDYIDEGMAQTAHLDYYSRLQEAGIQTYEGNAISKSNVPSGFPDKAFELAKSRGVAYVGEHTPSRALGLAKGRKWTYFYQIIKPEDPAGVYLQLGDNQVASVLWKQRQGAQVPSIVHISSFRVPPNISWNFRPLEDVLRHH